MWTPSFYIHICPFIGTPAADQEQNKADSDKGYHYTEPDFIGEWIHEGEHPWFLFVWLLDHNTNACLHKGFSKVYHSLSLLCYSERRYCYICSFEILKYKRKLTKVQLGIYGLQCEHFLIHKFGCTACV